MEDKELYEEVRYKNAYDVLDYINERLIKLARNPNGADVHYRDATRTSIEALVHIYEDKLRNQTIEGFINSEDPLYTLSLKNAVRTAKNIFDMDFEGVGD